MRMMINTNKNNLKNLSLMRASDVHADNALWRKNPVANLFGFPVHPLVQMMTMTKSIRSLLRM